MKISAAEEKFEQWRKVVGAVAAPLAMLITYQLATGLAPEGRKLAAILVTVGVLWMTEAIPLAATALLAAVLCISFGVAPAKSVLAYYADPIVFLFIGSFMLARAMTLHQLDRRIALGFLSIPGVGASPARVLAGMGFVTAIISMWVSNSATTSMMLPVALGVLGALHDVRVKTGLASGPLDARNWTYATGMMLMIGYSSAVGGIGTPVGSPPNLICIGALQRQGIEITFLQWMTLTVPMMFVMLVVLMGLLYWLHPDSQNASSRRELAGSIASYVQVEQSQLGPWTRGQVNTLIAFGVAVSLWVIPGVLALPIFGEGELASAAESTTLWLKDHIPESIAALIAAVLLFILPINARKGEFTITWPEAVKIDWGTILLFGGGLMLGDLMDKTGVAKAMGDAVTASTGVNSLWSITAVAIASGIILSEATSNTAASNIVIPFVIGICQANNISVLPPALGACLGASFGFMLPVSTPPNAIVYGSGLVTIPKMMRAGILFDIFGFFLILGGLRVLCPLLGLM